MFSSKTFLLSMEVFDVAEMVLYCYGLSYVPAPNSDSYVEIPNPIVTVSRDAGFRR